MNNMTPFYEILHDIVLRAGAQRTAEKMNRRYGTLMRELNPYDAAAKLGVETFIDIMRQCRDLRPLELLAREMGCRLIREEPSTTETSEERLGQYTPTH